MKTKIFFKRYLLAICFFSLFSPFTYAATVGLDVRPATTTVGIGESFYVEVYFTGDQFYASSDIGLDFDGGIVQFNNWTPGSGIIAFSPVDSFPMSESAPFTGNLADPGTGLLLATVNFTALDVGTTNISVDLGSLLLFTAPDAVAPGVLYDTKEIDFSSAQVQVIPVPAAIWLFGSGLLGILGVSRRQKHQ